MKTRGERITYIRKEILGYRSQAGLAERLGIERGAVGNWERDESIGRQNLGRLAEMAGCSIDWIERGIGEPPQRRERLNNPAGDAKPQADHFDREGLPVAVPKAGIREIDAAAGLGGGQTPDVVYTPSDDGMQAVDAFKEEAWVLPNRFMRGGLGAPADKIVAIATKGDSMSPTIGHGDVVFVDTRHTRVSPPGLYAIRDIYGEIIVKRLDVRRAGDEYFVIISSDNPHEPRKEEPLSEIVVFGRVCGRFNVM